MWPRKAVKVDSPRRLLWTGGWDSTYRLLDLLLVQKQHVQPYYVEMPLERYFVLPSYMRLSDFQRLVAVCQPSWQGRCLYIS